MPPSRTISSKGQITVPLEVRHRLGLREGDRVEFVVQNDCTVIRPAQPPVNPFIEDIGMVPAFGTRDQVNVWIREMRDDESEQAAR